jgi:hypothetical protein
MRILWHLLLVELAVACGGPSGVESGADAGDLGPSVDAAPPVLGTYAFPADRVTHWQPGVTGNGGIPARTTTCASLSPSGGDDTAAIQAALDACPADQVVQLSAGTFLISDQGLAITHSHITLRGAGPDATKLVAANPASMQYPIVIIGTRWYKWMQPVAFSVDATKEGNTVTIAGDPGLAVGELVHVDETYDPSLIYFNPATQNGDYQGWGEGRKGPQADSRPIGQAMEIASIQGNTITFTSTFHATYRTSHAAHLVRISNGAVVVPAVKWSGIEDLAVSYGNGGDGGGNIRFFATAYCWARHIESSHSTGASFAFDGAFRSEVRDSYLHSTADPNPGGAGYGIVFDTYTADSLAENDISWNFNKVIAMRSSGGGNVVGYNYFEDGYGAGYATIVEVGLNGSHMAGSHHELFEGNQAQNFDSDSYWGTQLDFTVFRNHFTTLRRSIAPGTANGVQVALTDQINRRGVGLTVHQQGYSFVGNVIGYPDGYLQSPAIGFAYPATFGAAPQGTTFHYEWLGGPFGNDASYTPIWQLGYDGSAWYQTQDAAVQASTIRDANFDYFTKAVHWHGLGGTGAGTTPSPVPTLSDTLYLPAKPGFFGGEAWPWVDGSDAQHPLRGVLPARKRFDAGTPNQI